MQGSLPEFGVLRLRRNDGILDVGAKRFTTLSFSNIPTFHVEKSKHTKASAKTACYVTLGSFICKRLKIR